MITSVQLCSEVIMQYNNSRDVAVQLRLGALFDLVENWRPRSEAIKELVRRAIEAEQQSVAQGNAGGCLLHRAGKEQL